MSNKFSESVRIVCNELTQDPEMWYSYKANIAMAFYDNFQWYVEKHGIEAANSNIAAIANNAAEYFLKLWTKDLTPQPPHEQEAVQTQAAEELAKIVSGPDGDKFAVIEKYSTSGANVNDGRPILAHINTSPGDGEYKLADEGDDL